MSGLDFSGLDNESNVVTGGIEEIKINLISEDPLQPRKSFTNDSMKSMIDSIKELGVLSPISVRKNPEKEGHFIITYGARRFRASKELGLKTIPVIVQEHTDINIKLAQITENLQREDVSPLEQASFFDDLLKENKISKTELAKKIGKPLSFLTPFLGIIEAPKFIKDLFKNQTIKAVRAGYDLLQLSKKYPSEVDSWLKTINDDEEITVAMIRELSKDLKGDKRDSPLYTEEQQAIQYETEKNDNEPEEKGYTPPPIIDEIVEVEYIENGSSNLDKQTDKILSNDPDKIKKPLLLAKYGKESYEIMLNKKPSTIGLIWLKSEATTEEIEVQIEKVKLLQLTDHNI